MNTAGPTKDFDLIPIPKRLRYDPTRSFPEFGFGLSLPFPFACTVIVADLYYFCSSEIVELTLLSVHFSEEFGITAIALIAHVITRYAVGLFFIAPLEDLLRRRQLILGLVFCSTTLMLCIALVPDWDAFLALSFLAGTMNVATQTSYLPPSRRFFFLSILISALVMGMLLARVLAGVITEYANWRVVYYLAVGMLVNFLASAGYSNFWTTLTFLLGGPPYNYSPLVIGLYGLVGIAGVCLTPLVTLTIDKLHPWYGSVLGAILYACFQGLLVAAAVLHFASILLAIIGIVVFCRVLQVSLQMSVFTISKAATSRLNALLLLSIMGSSVGSRVFLESRWRAGAGLSLGWTGLGFSLLLMRGPHCERKTWCKYEGGFGVRNSGEETGKKDSAENA
ncbi:uncharacterized protein BT62DRAFT_980978 [Guyanagaster necrorhizus]|uniref:MFS transporter n=1 Tax=Guyanagaster necrorhizus TaxID=856835 RepID=A0A9P7VUI7_9AGAR|nr:uncharacterized protein BT62DRAFT_980978 [Guyanagaster necrorhizus MCA 3950]KAG7446111.1 hypothetical protein BT62DRAFT_980978 [Guyanagaster necrorhizus MCA 3950]